MYDPCHRRWNFHGIYKDALGFLSIIEEAYFKLLELVANSPFVNILAIK
jgi:hypothetical protein